MKIIMNRDYRQKDWMFIHKRMMEIGDSEFANKQWIYYCKLAKSLPAYFPFSFVENISEN